MAELEQLTRVLLNNKETVGALARLAEEINAFETLSRRAVAGSGESSDSLVENLLRVVQESREKKSSGNSGELSVSDGGKKPGPSEVEKQVETGRRRDASRDRSRSRGRDRSRSRSRRLLERRRRRCCSRGRSGRRSRERSRGHSRGRSRGHSRGHSRGRSRGHSRCHSRGRSRDRSRGRSRDRRSRSRRSRSHSVQELTSASKDIST